MLYHIYGWDPQVNFGQCGGSSFSIQLWQAWRDAIAAHDPELTQDVVNAMVERLSPAWLRQHGYNPELYSPGSVRVSWGEWGPEHITIPGNGVGLDLDDTFGSPPGGRVLLPHNVDLLPQASLLLTVFLRIAMSVVSCLEHKRLTERSSGVT